MVTHSGSYPDRLWRVATAEDRLIERCLRAAGIAWTGDTPPPIRRSAAEVLADARRHGYGMSDPAQPPTAAEEKRAAQAEDPRFRTAMLGPENDLAQLAVGDHTAYWFPRTGCRAQAHITAYGSLDTWARIFYVPQEFNLLLGNQARADRQYQATLQKWRTCMAAHQHTYASPTEIVDELAARYRHDGEPLGQRRAEEIEIAVQDVTCDQQVELTTTYNALRREYARRIGPSERAELTRLTQLFEQARLRTST
ncbi:hypothetical protein ILP97_05005 [Amycolatopsis sp. H6(2020)]|nr:hypothetical protein [Amycolatopsis sp. H6(2020)]